MTKKKLIKKERVCWKCGEKLDSEYGVGGTFYYCINRTCSRFGLLVSNCLSEEGKHFPYSY